MKPLKQCDESGEQQSEIEIEQEQEQELESELESEKKPTCRPELMSADDMEFEMELSHDEESNQIEFIENKRQVKLVGEDGEEMVDIDENDVEGLSPFEFDWKRLN